MLPRVLGSILLLITVATSALRAADIDYNRDIRPLLADKCFACHGPDANKREADLRLDSEAGAYADRGGSPAVIVPGKPEESELFRRVTSDDPDMRMPPASSPKTLTAEQIELLRQWIAGGGKYAAHWSFQPPRRVSPPTAGAEWARNAIDHFVAAGHESQGFKPSPDADRRTLMRRLSFDLLGLPPDVSAVHEFVADEAEDAYEKQVDALLASPHFGERMAVYWLDVVRYADSGGYHSDNERDLSPYRDYVIRAFNSNLPFDQFTVEQIAGDLLDNPTTQQKVASGYNRLLQTTEEGGAQPKEYSAKYQADRVRNTAVAWIGMTMGCCECHDHKYDPLSAADFYRFGAFFADVQEKPVGRQDQIALPTPDQEVELARIDAELKGLQTEFDRDRPELAEGQTKWETQLRQEIAAGKYDWRIIKPEKVASARGATLTLQPDNSVLVSGKNPNTDTYSITWKNGSSPVRAVQLEALTHESLTNKSLSRANGNFVLTEVRVAVQTKEGESPTPVTIKTATASFSQANHPIEQAIDGKDQTGWAVAGHEKAADHQAMFVVGEPIPADATIVVELKHESEFPKHTIGRFRIATSQSENATLGTVNDLEEVVRAAVAVEVAQRNAEQIATLAKAYRQVAPELAELRMKISELRSSRDALVKEFPKTLISVSVPPRTVRVLPRGNWLDDSGEEVQPAVPASFSQIQISDRQKARLELGRWLASPQNPLTARVFVNRLWKLLFGQGIVKSLDDFGTQGASPTHPELLDWLAVEFMESGWNVKHMVKLMVMSRTYQQSSNPTPELRERDPANQWLARQSHFRLDAEMVRDNALAISGLLARKIGGPSVKPYKPTGYWRFLNFPVREWASDKGPNQYRRGLYTHWQRTFLHPSLLAFDAPSREECTVERPRSNTPLQALVLLNDPTYVEAARVLAAKTLASSGDDLRTGLEFAFQQALQRAPLDEELTVLSELWQKHHASYVQQPEQADAILKVGDAQPPAELDRPKLAAWTSVTRVILNLHETITRY